MHIKHSIEAKVSMALVGLTILTGFILCNMGSDGAVVADASAATNGTASASVTVADACSMAVSGNNGVAGEDGYTYSTTVNNGTTQVVTANSIMVSCNDYAGFKIYAIGYSGDTLGGTDMIASTSNDYNIKTDASGTYGSYWKMKLTKANSINTTIPSAYTSFNVIPDDYTLVAQYSSNTGNTVSTASMITPSYQLYVGSAQPAGTYTGKVKYTLVHPTSAAAPEIPKPELYNLVAAMSKGKNTDANSGFSWTSITAATSGVYEWDGKTTGNGVDSNGGSSKIYFYRGILDTTTATYGSNGMADAYPNYVKLANNTCWRIVRTTSTGGVKMIYNGIYGDTTAGSCANAQTKAQTRYNNADSVVPFNTDSATVAGKTYSGLQDQNIHAVGYTYTSSVAASTTATKTPAQLFGASGNDTTTNDKSSIMKQYIEDWYAANMTAYTSILEGDAGYCQDRRLNTGTTWTTALSESSNTIVPYGTSSMTVYYFGAYPRNTQSSTFNPLLTCPRGKVDLYSYSADAGNGNGQLTYPVALLTADEASLAGSGYNNSFNAYNANSFLSSGYPFWLLSPNYRNSQGALGFVLFLSGSLNNASVGGAITTGVRPAISLKPGTTAAYGSGTATDPWVVNPGESVKKSIIKTNYDSHVSGVTIGGNLLSQSGDTAELISGADYIMGININTGYVLDDISVSSGDAELSGKTLTVGNTDSVITITSQASTNVNVSFTFSNVTSVEVNGQTITTSGGSVSLVSGSTYSVKVTPANNSKLGDAGANITSGTWYEVSNVNTSNNTFDLTVGKDDGAITIATQSCITADTLITLADGNKKRAADLTGDEELLIWDFDTASYGTAPIVFIEPEPEAYYDIIHLFFEDETDLEISYEHGFFDYTLGEFIYINNDNPEQYIGHQFVMQDGGSYKTVELTDIKHETKYTALYGLTTYKHFNFFNNDMLSIEGNITGMFNYFDVDLATMGYDQAKKRADIEKYGLLTYEDFGGMIDELGFEAYNGQYLNVSIGKGLTTWENIKALADYYGHFTEDASQQSDPGNKQKTYPSLPASPLKDLGFAETSLFTK